MNIPIVSTALKGLAVGSAMLIPGVSGGTTAIILGIYDKLIHAVSNLFKEIKKSVLFLTVFCAGAGIGIVLVSRVMLMALEKWPLPVMFFFLGAIIGSVPMLYRQSRVSRFHPGYILCALFGVAIVVSLGFLPKPEASLSLSPVMHMVMLFVTGMIIAIGLVLPGISTSHMLLVLGMYQTTLAAIKGVNLPYLVPLALGAFAGILLTTKAIEYALTKHAGVSYFVIIGFVVGSVLNVFPGYPVGYQIPLCLVTLAAGIAVITLVGKFSRD